MISFVHCNKPANSLQNLGRDPCTKEQLGATAAGTLLQFEKASLRYLDYERLHVS